LTRLTVFNPDGTVHEVHVLPVKGDPSVYALDLIRRHRSEGRELRYGLDVPGEPQGPFSADEMCARAFIKKEFDRSGRN